jgi:hypothetical protein
VEAEVIPEMVALSVLAQQAAAEQGDETMASGGGGEVSVPGEEGQRETEATAAESSEETQEREGAGTIEGPVVVIEESAEPIMIVEIQVSCFMLPPPPQRKSSIE